MTGERPIAFVALSAPTRFDLEQIGQAARTLFPNSPVRIEPLSAVGDEPGRLGVLLNGVMLVLIQVPASIPRPVWENSAQESMTWPEATAAFERHEAHVIVAPVQSTTGHREVLATALAVSVLTALVCECVEAQAVYWDTSTAVCSPQSFIGHIQAMLAASDLSIVPTDIWVRIRFTKGNDPYAVGAITTGLIPFVGREIEFMPARLSALEVAERVVSLATYLIRRGPVIKDRETVGITEKEKIHARHLVRGRDPGVPVIALSYDEGAFG